MYVSIFSRIIFFFNRLLQYGPFLGLFLLMCACEVLPIAVTTVPPAAAVSPDIHILIIPPSIRFERTENEAPITDQDLAVQAFAAELLRAAEDITALRKFETVTSESFTGSEIEESCVQLHSLSYRLARGAINEESLSVLKNLASLDDHLVVLTQHMKIKIGPGGSWNFNSGAITSHMTSSIIQASLISSQTGEVFWKNEVLLRTFPRIDSLLFKETLQLLFKSFVWKKEG